MPTKLDIRQGDYFNLDAEGYRFQEEMPDGRLLFFGLRTGEPLWLPEAELTQKLGNGTAVALRTTHSVRGMLTRCANAPLSPGQENSKKAIRARTLRFYVGKWDDCPDVGLGDVGLRNFIDALRPIARQQGLVHKVQPARLRWAINNCGEPGDRHADDFLSQQGKVKRDHFPDFVVAALAETVEWYWSLRQRTYTSAYAHFHAIVDAENERRVRAGEEPLKRPKNDESIRLRIDSAEDFDHWARKYTRHEAIMRFQGCREGIWADAPLDLVIFDHQRMDVFVLDTDTNIPLGRPWLTLAIDVCTRAVLGYLITFENPSLYSVMTTLKRVCRPKDYVAQLFPNIQGRWCEWGRPLEMLVDNAWEFKAPSLKDALRNVGISLTWAPVHEPQYKAIGERAFRTLNEYIFHFLPGAVRHPPTVLRDIRHDPSKDAVLPVGVLDDLLHQAIIEIHQVNPNKYTNEIPALAWQEKLKRQHFVKDVKALDSLLAREASVVLTRAGIRFKNMVFHERDVVTRLLQDMLRCEPKRTQRRGPISQKKVRVKITWNDLDASSITVWNHAGEPHPHGVRLLNRDWRFVTGQRPIPGGAKGDPCKAISFWHADQIFQYAKSKSLAFRTESERYAARDRLTKAWEKAAGLLAPKVERKPAMRGLSQLQAPFEMSLDQPLQFSASDIAFAQAEPSTAGMSRPTLVPDQILAFEHGDDEVFRTPTKGRKPSPTTVRKAQRTKQRKKQEREDEQRDAAPPTSPPERLNRPAKPDWEPPPAAKATVDYDPYLDGDDDL